MAIPASALTDEDIRQQVVSELKWAAERAVLRVRGVKAVANEVEVRLPAGDERTDLDVAAAAHALAWNTRVPDDAVQVTVSNGWVTPAGRGRRGLSAA